MASGLIPLVCLQLGFFWTARAACSVVTLLQTTAFTRGSVLPLLKVSI